MSISIPIISASGARTTRDVPDPVIQTSTEFPGVQTAAAKFGWGTPNREDQFNTKPAWPNWQVYSGAGHAGNGTRSPNAVSVANGIMSITGDASGQTGGLAWRDAAFPTGGGKGQKYGRWEVAMKTTAGSLNYHPVLLLWEDAQIWPGSEVDFCEILDSAARTRSYLFLHYAVNGQLDPAGPGVGSVNIDCTKWHAWAVEWTPTKLTTYVDGNPWYSTTDTSKLPPRPLHLCLQLDNFGGDLSQGGRMDFAWARQYSL